MNTFMESARDFTMEVAKRKDSIILEQLNDLIKDGLLVVEQDEMQLIQDELTGQIKYAQHIRLRLRYQEAYDQMKKERDEAVATLQVIREHLNEGTK